MTSPPAFVNRTGHFFPPGSCQSYSVKLRKPRSLAVKDGRRAQGSGIGLLFLISLGFRTDRCIKRMLSFASEPKITDPA